MAVRTKPPPVPEQAGGEGPPADILAGNRRTARSLAAAAKGCRACDLYKNATQTVFGEGPDAARVIMIGEQPGDREDREGGPFVGPAGGLLDRALAEAGIDRDDVYVTNVVKHFKWLRRGKRRIHKKPNSEEIAACRPWLDAELRVVKPDIVVCLGATAAQAILGKGFLVTQRRGEFVEWGGALATATVHPSSILRARDDASRHDQMRAFVEDLRAVATRLAKLNRRVARPVRVPRAET
jgi:DNA polymerase